MLSSQYRYRLCSPTLYRSLMLTPCSSSWIFDPCSNCICSCIFFPRSSSAVEAVGVPFWKSGCPRLRRLNASHLGRGRFGGGEMDSADLLNPFFGLGVLALEVLLDGGPGSSFLIFHFFICVKVKKR